MRGLEALGPFERSDPEEQQAVVAFVAGQSIAPDHDELKGALRRAQLLLAAGGDPRRDVPTDHRAVQALAADLETPARIAALLAELDALTGPLAPYPRLAATAATLRADPPKAWLAYAHALLADLLDSDLDTDLDAP